MFRRAIHLTRSVRTTFAPATAFLIALFPSHLHAAPDPRVFLETYCFECHGPEKQKGDRRFDTLAFPLADAAGVIDVQDIIDQLNLEEMPPEKAKRHPEPSARTAIIKALTQSVASARASLASTGGQTILRRLNRREYLNTVSDLTGLQMISFDPTTRFPRDQQVAHMDNIGDALVTSGYLLDQYLDAADTVIEKALGKVEQPRERTWRFKGNFQQGQELDHSHKRVYNYRYLCVYEVPNTVNHEGGYAAIHDFSQGVPDDGWYEIKVLAHAMNRKHPYDPDIFKMDPKEPFRLGVVPGDVRVGTLHHPQPIEPQLAEVTVADGKPQWHTMKVWLERGQTPRFIFPNGMANCRRAFGAIASRYKKQWPKNDPYKGGIVEARRIVLQHGKMPHIRIHEVGVRGPIYPQWPPSSQRLVYGDEGFREDRSREILKNFADRAYRRPATSEEIDRLIAIVNRRKKEGRNPRESLNDALKAVLCSPAFLYMQPLEPAPNFNNQKSAISNQQLRVAKAYALATRLSYFLWSTTPDAALRAKADDGDILKPAILKAEVDRLLADARSDEFIEGFLDSWLNLRYLGEMPPDRDTFGAYYAKDLQNAMVRETRLFTRHLIETDGPITNYLDSGYTFVNKPLAAHYGLKDTVFEPSKAHEFRRVNLTDPRRGGLLGMGSVLTVTANGIETSPVTRGVWLLENVFGTPPAPPPDDVPPIDPDIRGATTIRDQLAKHRESTTCNECHRKIDPPGFALENFDPIGGWRTHYPQGKNQGPRIDASSELPSGESFTDVIGFKKLLLETKRKHLFSRMLTERLLTYATGRRIEPLDRLDVNHIARQVATEGYGMRTLIEKAVLSPVFRSR